MLGEDDRISKPQKPSKRGRKKKKKKGKKRRQEEEDEEEEEDQDQDHEDQDAEAEKKRREELDARLPPAVPNTDVSCGIMFVFFIWNHGILMEYS